MKRRGVLLADFDNWKGELITKDGSLPLNRRETLHYTYVYLRWGNGLLIKRLTSVMKRLVTGSLKPSQVSSEKCNDGTSP